MADITKQLQCELETENEWQIRQDQRVLKLSSMSTNTPQEKALFRQVKDIVSYTTKLEKVLRTLMGIETTANVGAAENFNDTVKKNIIQQQRLLLTEMYEREAYLQMAKDVGYAAAEEFVGSDSKDTMLDEERKKKYDEIKKKHAKVDKNKEPKYKMRDNNWKFQKGYGGLNAKYPYAYDGQNFGMMKSFSVPYGNMQQFGSMGAQHTVGPQQIIGAQQVGPAGGYMPTYRPWKNFAPKYMATSNQQKKANSKCRACDGIGHWQGDLECPVVMAAFGMGGSEDVPAPPGTG